MTIKRKFSIGYWLLTVTFVCTLAVYAAGQSPNNASLIIEIVDQSGATIPDASVTVLNTATGLRRDGMTSPSGSVTLGALLIIGSYRVVVAKPGFADKTVTDIVLRAGEAAQLHVKLFVTGAESSVEVFGTAVGVSISSEVGAPLQTARIDETPLLGRKISFLPLLSGAFRNAKGTGDLFMNSVFFVTGGRRPAADGFRCGRCDGR